MLRLPIFVLSLFCLLIFVSVRSDAGPFERLRDTVRDVVVPPVIREPVEDLVEKAKREAEKLARDAAAAAEKAKRDAEATAEKAAQDAAATAEKARRDAEATAEKARRDAEATAEKARKDAAATAEKARRDAEATAEKARKDAKSAVEKAAQDASTNLEKAAKDLAATVEKAGKDTTNAYIKAGSDVLDAGLAVAKYAERQAKSPGDILSAAEQRLREGKLVDAVWHAYTDPWKHTERNAFAATQESNIVNAAGQLAASTYGGAGGAAAYAAWQTYRQTGNAEMAIRMGFISGATSAAFGAVNKIPSDQLAAKAIMAGTIGGLAVAAAGGDEAAVREGFLRSGGMVLIQDGYKRVTHHELDPKASEGEPYCMASVKAPCSPPDIAYERDESGNIARDAKGNPKVDVRKTDPRRPHVGTWAKADEQPTVGVSERSGTMVAVSKVPVMNAMSVFHDQWAVSWNMDLFTSAATIAPAVVLTYAGTDSPYFQHLQETAVEKEKEKRNGDSK